MKAVLAEKMMAEFVGYRPKTCSYLIDHGSGYKKVKEQKSV